MFHAKAPSAKGIQPTLNDEEPCAMFGVCCNPETREIVDAASVFETARAEHHSTPFRFDTDIEDDEDRVAAETALAPHGPAPTVPPKRTEQQTQATETPRSEPVNSDNAEEEEEEEEALPEAGDVEEEPEDPDVLRAVFRAPGESAPTVVRFIRRPLGFILLADTMPPTVGRVVSGHAHELGVRSDWALERLSKVSFGSDPAGFKEAAATCRRLANKLPQEQAAELLPVGGSLEVVFCQRREALRPVQVVFHCRPLGIDFDRNVLPLTVLTAYGAAARLGVEPGWTVARFGGAELGAADCTADFDEAIKVVKSLIAKLPQREHILPETNSCVVQ